MRMYMLTVFAALFLVTACSSSSQNDGSADGMATERVPITGLEAPETSDSAYDMQPMDSSGPAPGTQQDLVVNIGDRVFFDYDQYDLRADARATIERQAQWLRAYPSLAVTIQGHADERGTREYNLALGEKRAIAVRKYLIALGIESSRIDTVSFGKERPAVLGSNEESWAQNPRSVTVVR